LVFVSIHFYFWVLALEYNRVAHGSLFSSIFASFFVPFFARFGGRFHHLAGENGMKITIKNDEKWLL